MNNSRQKEPGAEPSAADDNLQRELARQLDAIRQEEVPERLILLAQELQRLLLQRESGGHEK